MVNANHLSFQLGRKPVREVDKVLPAANSWTHSHGTIAELGVLFAKIETDHDECSSDVVVSKLQLEWSRQLVRSLSALVGLLPGGSASSKVAARPLRFRRFGVDVDSVVVFVVHPSLRYLVGSAKSVKIENNELSSLITSSAIKIGSGMALKQQYDCSLKKLPGDVLVLPELRILRKELKNELKLDKGIELTWSIAVHLILHETWLEAAHFLKKKMAFSEKSARQQPSMSLVTDRMLIQINLPKKHSFNFALHHVTVSLTTGYRNIVVSKFVVSADMHHIAHFQGLLIITADSCDYLREHRSFIPELQAPDNRVLDVYADSIDVVFPFGFQFSQPYQEMTMVWRWLSSRHRAERHARAAEGPAPAVPADVRLRVSRFTVQLMDDEFEVKLLQNVKLMEDEHEEQEKRLSLLNNSLEGLNRQGLRQTMTPAALPEEHAKCPSSGHVEAALRRKSSEIFIGRSKAMRRELPTRAPLFTFQMENMEWIFFADPLVSPRSAAISNVARFDSGSPNFPSEFSSLYSCHLLSSTNTFLMKLRDFRQPLLDVTDMTLGGPVVFAQARSPSFESERVCFLELGDPWGAVTLRRNMSRTKMYQALTLKCHSFVMSYGPCWAPTFSQVSASCENLRPRSVDPSPFLPYWDRLRLLWHGPFDLDIGVLRMLYHTSLDPQNLTQMFELQYQKMKMRWVKGQVDISCDFDVIGRMASKFHDCNILHIPNAQICLSYLQVTDGDPRDHHSIHPVSPDSIDMYKLKIHDTYKRFRLHYYDVDLSFKLRPGEEARDKASISIYLSTLKIIDDFMDCLRHVNRPIRKGKVHDRVKSAKPSIGSKFRNFHVLMEFPRLSMLNLVTPVDRRGFELNSRLFHLKASLTKEMPPDHNDGLIHRRRPLWKLISQTIKLDNIEMSVYCSGDKVHLGSISSVTYERKASMSEELLAENLELYPAHHLLIEHFEGIWTLQTCSTLYNIIHIYEKSRHRKKNLSCEALQPAKREDVASPSAKSAHSSPGVRSPTSTFGSASTALSDQAHKLLIDLINNPGSVAFTEEVSNQEDVKQKLDGYDAATKDKIISKKWLVELKRSRIILKGHECDGFVVASTDYARFEGRMHSPVWRHSLWQDKVSCIGCLEGVQYFSCKDSNIEQGISDNHLEDASWSNDSEADLTPTMTQVQDPLLQQISQKCSLEIFCTSHEPATHLSDVPPPAVVRDATELQIHDSQDITTLLHHDLHVVTDHAQFLLLIDIINNVLLYTEPEKKENQDLLKKMMFKVQLSSAEDQRTPILQTQTQMRLLIGQVSKIENMIFWISLHLEQNRDASLKHHVDSLKTRLTELQKRLDELCDHLDRQLICYFRSRNLEQTRKQPVQLPFANVLQVYECCFKHADWRVTQDRLDIAELMLCDFLYTKSNGDDGSISHYLQVGYLKIENYLGNTHYDVLKPQVGRSSQQPYVLRILCRLKQPVGGISIKEYLEVLLVPVAIQGSVRFLKTFYHFFFPKRQADDDSSSDDERDDVTIMKRRAESTNMFIHAKLMDFGMKIAIKGNKSEQTIVNLTLKIPPLEIHNRELEWRDLAHLVKRHCAKFVISQLLKQRSMRDSAITMESLEEEEKAALLLGHHQRNSLEKPRRGKK